MKTRLLLMAILLVSIVIAQKQSVNCWNISLHHKPLLRKQQSINTLCLPLSGKGNLKLRYNCDVHPENYWRSFIIMDENRKELTRINTENNNYSLINIAKLKEITGIRSFVIYTVAIPKDSATAMTMRISPLFLTNISWQ